MPGRIYIAGICVDESNSGMLFAQTPQEDAGREFATFEGQHLARIFKETLVFLRLNSKSKMPSEQVIKRIQYLDYVATKYQLNVAALRP